MSSLSAAVFGPGEVFEGWDVGAVTIKRVWLRENEAARADVCRHGGEPEKVVRDLLRQEGGPPPHGVVVTGPQASSLFELPYLPEAVCLEAALRRLQHSPDLVLSLGGESFVVYCVAGGTVHDMLSSNRCAAGSGEFLVQQFGRMNLDLQRGIQAARTGRRVKLASRCSVHCKSDATHKLNKGECSPDDIAASLIADLALKIARLVESANWSRDRVLLAGGLTENGPLVEELRGHLPGSRIEVAAESGYLEAFGAAVAAREAGARPVASRDSWLKESPSHRFAVQKPLGQFADSVEYMAGNGFDAPHAGEELILGLDAGSTTTKAVLLARGTGRPVAGCYLRTHGNPVQATSQCLTELRGQLAASGASRSDQPPTIVQAAVTGSGRDLVSVYLDSCLSFNEILAHARAARDLAPEVDTLFELGGQDAKFVALQSGIPVDYSMNDGCSAGTGSFLEEAAASDMRVPIEGIGPLALSGANPVAFGERCAAFINSEVRSALQQGAPRADVLAGLVYAITDNYLSRVVGARHIGRTVLLQGGVALNRALAPAIAARTGTRVLVPPHPELMGCIGAARMAEDLLAAGIVAKIDRNLGSFGNVTMETRSTFRCRHCDNLCEIKKISLGGRVYPFGGLCAKWEMQRRPRALRCRGGKDLVSLRNELMFRTFAPQPPAEPRGRIGLPLALSTYQLFPLYAKLVTQLGFQVVLSRPGSGTARTYAPTCYPGEIVIAAVDDLLARGVDHVFLPYLRELPIPAGHAHAYLCPVVNDLPAVIKAAFHVDAARILSPEMGLSDHLLATTHREIVRLAARLGVQEGAAREALTAALEHQRRFEEAYREAMEAELRQLKGPAVVLVGRPYAAFAPEVNLSVPRKIASRGFTVIPGDGLPFAPPANERDVWHVTQRVLSAVDHARRDGRLHVCALSCFSCGPDAILHHRFRHEMEGSPFCFLEIDSHTAHAGIETRIGAFLDIIEERNRLRSCSPPARPSTRTARIARDRGKFFVDDSRGRRVELDDPRVRHFLLADVPRITSEIIAALYGRFGWETAALPDTSYETLQKARKVCSGRECLPFLAMMGKVVAHLEARSPGEVTVFHLLEQEGPCQIGNWYDAFSLIVGQLHADDVVAVWPTIKNNYLGGGEKLALHLTMGVILGDLMVEARSALRCLAVDKEAALSTLDALEKDLLAAARRGPVAIDRELRRIARKLAEIPMRGRPGDAPKVLLFGGINRIFVDKPVREFFENRGILTKTNDISEFVSLVESEWTVRSGFAHGRTRPEEQDPLFAILADIVKGPCRSGSLLALRAHVHCRVIEHLEKRWRRVMAGSGLLFSPHVPFHEVAREGHHRVSCNGFTEAPFTVGRYFGSLRKGVFDGYVNVGSFNCAPANSATAVINALNKHSERPYAAIDADGTVITPSQMRQLETVAARCLRRERRRAERPT